MPETPVDNSPSPSANRQIDQSGESHLGKLAEIERATGACGPPAPECARFGGPPGPREDEDVTVAVPGETMENLVQSGGR
jgi:hypothetical protein